MASNENRTGRRSFLFSAGVLTAAPLLGCAASATAAQPAARKRAAASSSLGRRRLGKLEVSSVGLGVQNTSRTYQTTIPYRPEMIELIRTAFDRGVTFFDAAEAYGPHEVERILGEAIAPFRDQVVDRDEVRLEHRPRDRRAPARPEQPAGANQARRRWRC